MRWMVAVAVLALAACDSGTVSVNGNEIEAGGGYTLEIRASEMEQAYLVTTPDGRTVGARAAEGASALMDADRAQALFAEPPPQNNDDSQPEVFSLRMPGIEMSVSGTDDGNGGGESGRVSLRTGGNGTSVTVHADEGGPGEADDRAYVRIAGANEETVRDFIADADELSPEVQAQMLAELGLN